MNMKYSLFLLMMLITLVNAKPLCDDQCGLKKSEQLLKIALEVLKVIEGGDHLCSANNETNNLNNNSGLANNSADNDSTMTDVESATETNIENSTFAINVTDTGIETNESTIGVTGTLIEISTTDITDGVNGTSFTGITDGDNGTTFTGITDTDSENGTSFTGITDTDSDNGTSLTGVTDTNSDNGTSFTGVTDTNSDNGTSFTGVSDTNSETSTTNMTDSQSEYSTVASTNELSTTTNISVMEIASSILVSSSEKPDDEESNKTKLKPTNCADILILGYTVSGVYEIFPRWHSSSKCIKVFCDMETEGGGWTVFQRRDEFHEEHRQSFNQSFDAYATGFGELDKEFWLGNELIHKLTNQERMVLRIELEDWEGNKRFACYKGFIVASAKAKYRMSYTFFFNSTVGNSLQFALSFVTADRDDSYTHHPARKMGAGYWYSDRRGIESNLNGVYYSRGQHLNKLNGIFWKSFHNEAYSLKKVEMKLRPEFFIPGTN